MGLKAPKFDYFLQFLAAFRENSRKLVAVDQAALSRMINFARKRLFIKFDRELPHYFYNYLATLTLVCKFLEDYNKLYVDVQRWLFHIFGHFAQNYQTLQKILGHA